MMDAPAISAASGAGVSPASRGMSRPAAAAEFGGSDEVAQPLPGSDLAEHRHRGVRAGELGQGGESEDRCQQDPSAHSALFLRALWALCVRPVSRSTLPVVVLVMLMAIS